MRFKCRKEALQEALSLLCSIVPSRSTKPIIQNIRVEGLENNIIEMCATDLDVGLRYTLEVNELSDPEAVILPSMELSSIVRDAWGESITIEVTDNQANVITEGAKFRLPGESADEFPTIPAIDEEIATEIRAEDMSIAIGQTLFATAREDHQYSLAGVYINLEGKKMEMVTTDTFRLALSTKPLHKEVEKATSAIVLAKRNA